jgi:excisionase family DNA binding protein
MNRADHSDVTELSIGVPDEFVEAVARRSAEIVLDRLREESAAGTSPWLSLGEAAAYLRVSERQVQRLVKGGRIRSSTIGRRRLLHRDDLDRAATGEDVAPTTSPRRREE